MIKIDVLNPQELYVIGHTLENGFESLEFDVSAWLTAYPGATVTLIYQRPDGDVYPVVTGAAESPVIWQPASDDLRFGGAGKIEAQVSKGEMLGKSDIIRVRAKESLPEPAAAPGWMRRSIDTVENAKAAAQTAATSAEAALQQLPAVVDGVWTVYDPISGERVPFSESVLGEVEAALGPGAVLVMIDETEAGSYTADMTHGEICAAIDAGHAVFAKVNMGFLVLYLPLLARTPNNNTLFFGAVGSLRLDETTDMVNVIISPDGTVLLDSRELTPKAGADGVSPTVQAAEIDGGHQVTITDKDGEHTFDVLDGHTPRRGVDYWTDADKQAMIEDMVRASGFRGCQFEGDAAPYDCKIYGDWLVASAFNRNASSANLKTVVMLGDPVTIPDSAFRQQTALESVVIPDSVTTIGSNAFYGCTALKEITIPDSVTSIGSGAFYGCTALQSVYLANVPGIVSHNNTFYNCRALKSFLAPKLSVINQSTNSASGSIFHSCTALETVQLGSEGYAVTSISQFAFYGCTSPATAVTIYTVSNYVNALLTNVRNGATNATIIIKAANDTEYNGTVYAAGETIMTSNP